VARLVPAAGDELDGLDPENVFPVRLVFDHQLDHRLGLGRRAVELDHLVDLTGDDRIEDHPATIRRRGDLVFGLSGRVFLLARSAQEDQVLSIVLNGATRSEVE
jgi:hypothetical protein